MNDTNTLYCTRCNSTARLERVGETASLVVLCACDERRSVRVSEALPDEWVERGGSDA